MTPDTPKDSPDLRGRILAWIDAELKYDGHPALRALRGEVERHEYNEGFVNAEGTDVNPWCGECVTDERGVVPESWPCDFLTRIASQLGVEP